MVGQDVMRCLMALGLVLQGLSFGAQAAPGGAVELYRYVNDKGVVVLDRQGVPPQYIGKGYQVLNDQGRVIRTVPPAPTAEELRQRKAAQAQASSDAQLLRLYSSLEDVDRARERRLAELDGLSSVARGATCSRSSCNRPTCKARRPTRSVPDVRWRRRWWTNWTISSRRKSACRVRSGASRRPAKRRKEPMPPTARGSPSYSA